MGNQTNRREFMVMVSLAPVAGLVGIEAVKVTPAHDVHSRLKAEALERAINPPVIVNSDDTVNSEASRALAQNNLEHCKAIFRISP